MCSGWALSKLVLLKSAYLIVAGSHQSIVAQVPADISRDDFTVDAITGHEILVHASRGSRHGGEQLTGSGLRRAMKLKDKATRETPERKRERARKRESKREEEGEGGKRENDARQMELLRAGPLC